jgi:hypothetical protein
MQILSDARTLQSQNSAVAFSPALQDALKASANLANSCAQGQGQRLQGAGSGSGSSAQAAVDAYWNNLNAHPGMGGGARG